MTRCISYFWANMERRLDRTVGPTIKPIRKLVFPPVNKTVLSNGIPVYSLPGGTQEIIKLELVYKAGRSKELNLLAAKTTASLLKEGTQNYTGDKLDEKIDFYGITIASTSGMDTSNLVLYCLKKHLETALELLEEIMARPVFPKEELARYTKRSEERLLQELSKNDVVSYRMITEKVFGAQHPYGYNSQPESYRAVNLEQVKTHFQKFYNADNCKVYLSGKIDDQVLKQVDNCLSRMPQNSTPERPYMLVKDHTPEHIKISGNKIQNSIKIGKRLFKRDHPDYPGFFLLNTILGGYFGARLMSKIREEKGYTYNIYSYLDQLENEGSFFISTEVGSEYHELTLSAISDELSDLQNSVVSDKELDMAKNYIMGNFLNLLDGPIKSSKYLKMIVENDLELDYLPDLSEKIIATKAQSIIDLAQKHLIFDQMFKISVGDF